MDSVTLQRIRDLSSPGATAFDLVAACLLIAQQGYPDMRPTAYLNRLQESIDTLAGRLHRSANRGRRLQALHLYYYEQAGYHGNTDNYYDPRNSYMNEVMDRHTGLPITLSLLYMALGQGIGLPLAGVAFPGHFLVCLQYEDPVYLDPFNQGRVVSRAELEQQLENLGGSQARLAASEFLTPATPLDILLRNLRNLKNAHMRLEQPLDAIRTLDILLGLAPGLAPELKARGLLYAKLQCPGAAAADLEAYLDLEPQAEDAEKIARYADELSHRNDRLH